MSLYPDSGSQSDNVALVLPDSGDLAIDRWVSYRFNSDFLCPTDAWSFRTAGASLKPEIVAALRSGQRALLRINGKTQGGGFIDVVARSSSRESGLVYDVHGRDCFGPIVDAGADPTLFNFKHEQTVADVVKTVFGQFGFASDDDFVVSNDANRTVMTGVRVTTRKGRALKAIKVAQQLQPYPSEGCFAFVSRFLHRLGLWAWPTADQSQVVVGEPSFDQPSAARLVRRRDGKESNVLFGEVREDGTDQPSVVVATGFAEPGVEWPRAKLKAYAINELTGVEVDASAQSLEMIATGAVTNVLGRVPDAAPVTPGGMRDVFTGYRGKFFRPDAAARPLFLHDDEAKTLDALKRFVRRELSLRQCRMWTGSYVVKGHTQRGAPWAVDTIVTVDDDECDFHGPMWVKARTFEKSREHGTLTHLELILPNTLSFGD